jgi:hypothetical protein
MISITPHPASEAEIAAARAILIFLLFFKLVVYIFKIKTKNIKFDWRE